MDKASIIRLIADDRLDDVLEYLNKKSSHDSRLNNQVILLQGRLASLKRNERLGLEATDQTHLQANRVRHAIQELVDVIFRELVDEASGEERTKRTILFLGASPKDLDVLRINEEIQKIKDGMDAATYRERFDFEAEPAVQIRTITKAMMEYKPAIVHFSGHGTGATGLSVENEIGEEVLFTPKGLDRLFRLSKDHVQCVVLNACYASEQAEMISQHGMYVIGMNKDIGDAASIAFSVGFYQSLGEGQDYERAFDYAMVHISVHSEDANTPELWKDGAIVRQ